MYKFFTSRFGNSPQDNIRALRKQFPNMHFARGMRKDVDGIYCLHDTDTRDYGESWETTNGDIFYSPSESNVKKLIESLPKYKTEYKERLPVKLSASSVTLDIFPASAIPQRVLFTKRVESVKDETKDCPYNTTDEYGKLAYELYFRSRNGEELKFTDDIFQSFIKLVLTRSYTIPMEIWDSLQLISYGDFDPLFAAGCGISQELLGKILAESSGQQ